MINISPFATRLKSTTRSVMPKRINVDGDILNFGKNPQMVKLRVAISNALRVWSNQSNTHFCDRASQYLLPFAKSVFPDAYLFKIRPKNVNFHEIIVFDSNNKVLDTQMSQFNVPEKIANKYVYSIEEHSKLLGYHFNNN